MVAFDWSNIDGFEYWFDIARNSKYAKQLKEFNGRYMGLLRVEDDMFITAADGTRTLIANPLNTIRKQIATEIAEIRSLQDAEEQQRLEAHLAILLDSTMIFGIGANGRSTSIRSSQRLTDLAETVNRGGERRLQLMLTTEQWRFKKGWRLHLFSKIQLEGHGNESSDEDMDNNNGNENEDSDDDSSNSLSTAPATNGVDDRLTKILEEQQKLIADLAQRTNSTNQVPRATSQLATRQLPQDLTWNTNDLLNGIRQRHDMSEKFLTSDQMQPFVVENKDNAGNVISTVNANYYLHFDDGLQKLITRSGLCVDFSPIVDKKATEKLFTADFPSLQSDMAAHIRKWYREITTHAHQHHVYIHPYFNFRRNANHNRGFTIGDDFPNDLPKQYAEIIREWGSLIYKSLSKDKVIPASCATIKATIQNYESGQGYEALWGAIKSTHPNHLRPYETDELVREPPKQKVNEGFEHYFFFVSETIFGSNHTWAALLDL